MYPSIMYQSTSNADLDRRKVIKSIAQLNPHVSLSDIAYLMGAPYEFEPGEFEELETAEHS